MPLYKWQKIIYYVSNTDDHLDILKIESKTMKYSSLYNKI